MSFLITALLVLSTSMAQPLGDFQNLPSRDFMVTPDYGKALFQIQFAGERQNIGILHQITDVLAINASIEGYLMGENWEELPKSQLSLIGRLLNIDEGILLIETNAGMKNLNQFNVGLRMGLNLPSNVGLWSILVDGGIQINRGYEVINYNNTTGDIRVSDVVDYQNGYIGIAGRISLAKLPLIIGSRIDFTGIDNRPGGCIDITGRIANKVFLGASIQNLFWASNLPPKRLLNLYYTL